MLISLLPFKIKPMQITAVSKASTTTTTTVEVCTYNEDRVQLLLGISPKTVRYKFTACQERFFWAAAPFSTTPASSCHTSCQLQHLAARGQANAYDRCIPLTSTAAWGYDRWMWTWSLSEILTRASPLSRESDYPQFQEAWLQALKSITAGQCEKSRTERTPVCDTIPVTDSRF